MKTFEEVWKSFLSENGLHEPDRITRTRDWAEKFYGWLADSGLIKKEG